MTQVLKRHIALILFQFFAMLSFAQNDDAFNSSVNTLLEASTNSYEEIDAVLGDFKRDSTKMLSLLDMAKTNKKLNLQSYAQNALGIIHRDISNYERAIDYHKNAEDLAKQNDNIELQVISLNMLGVVYRRMDVVKPALDYHSEALELANTVDNKSKRLKLSIAVSQNSMGNIYLALKQYDLAIEQFNKSLIIEIEEENKLGLAINYHNIGYAQESKGNLEDALINYQRSLEYNNQIDSDLGRIICHNSIGEIYIQQGQYKEAELLIEDALEKALLLGDQYYISSTYLNLGRLKLENNTLNKAKQYLDLGLKTATQYNLKSSIVEANKLLSDFNTRKGNDKLAFNHYKAAISTENTIANERNVQYANDIILQHETEAKNREIEVLADKLEQNKKVFWYALLTLVFFAAVIIAYNRTQQLKKEKQILTLEQDMLRSQMNPHFIFNSLNSIKLYIINNEKENAVYYLNKFSKLIRKILVASTEKVISLKDELDTMELYINIENIRFSNAIQFSIDIDENVDANGIKLPSLVLQPFLENALWHGLSTKKEDKQIHLKVMSENDYVTISITDNGVGRKEAQRIKKAKILKQKSIGIEITKARLANFSKDFFGDYNLDIVDLVDASGNALGTRVNLKIPLMQINLKTA
ncbi:tetratricopeptide repeat protein [Ichthyenterobacterium sp. W332]|uniref:Tetratricopeptide repeat protein n=1 Tax=Microcosmobacter mediterraneus TaxID=3075607 RepID=A0ABU2YJW6_9FLAO|nr:tetratricopeptide repeat protein [Ichthyenterobacterium sp. W332]MDT0558176.1 tetratricopeptide repeat protein [Ichthyenterobacterium sp. W332]